MARKDSKGRNLHTGESQRKDGTYMYRYVDAKSGKRQTIYSGDLPELRVKEKQIAKDLDDCLLTDSAVKKMTVDTLFSNYMATRKLSDSTRVNYEKLWKNHVRDKLGGIKVMQLRSSHIKSFYAEMSTNGYSRSTIKLIHTLLYPALEMAVDDDVLRKNPAKNTLSGDYGEAPKEKSALNLNQQEKLCSFIRRSNVYNMYAPMYAILLGTGLRCGELIGLTWNDVNMQDMELSINHQLIYKDYGDGEGYTFHASTPKTNAGIRTIPLTEMLYKAFAEQREINFMLERRSTDEIDGYSDFIFLAKTGRPLMPSAVNSIIYNTIAAYNKEEIWKAKMEERNAELLPKISVHCLRHTACTNMARQGMNIKVLQYLMGHAKSDVTMDVYNHLACKDDVREEVERYAQAAGI